MIVVTEQIKIKLTDMDRKILFENLNICTDSHGGTCINTLPAEKDNVYVKI